MRIATAYLLYYLEKWPWTVYNNSQTCDWVTLSGTKVEQFSFRCQVNYTNDAPKYQRNFNTHRLNILTLAEESNNEPLFYCSNLVFMSYVIDKHTIMCYRKIVQENFQNYNIV